MKQITVLGVGNILFSDEGLGVRVVEALDAAYTFSPNVNLVDGGVLGLNLLSTLSDADHLIVVDAVKNGGEPGTLHRLEGEQIPSRILAKNSLHQVDLLESLTLCKALDNVPETVILGAEPLDINTLSLELTPPVEDKVDDLVDFVCKELDRLGAEYWPRDSEDDRQIRVPAVNNPL
ncbi:MAG: HyaD/HybD family hydrogenase maturation endopeptidase [Deltaproteobacteria bacterium]|nr:HyaD/HybD family hydrogenase maturation endopeptidase [Deltaproteobacteria bacterium]